MVKKKEKIIEETNDKSNNEYEKLREELFEYSVDIKSYKNSMNTLWICVTVVIAILGFLGYDKLEALLDRVEKSANDKLARTDSLLSKVDTHYLDSLTNLVNEKTIAYEATVEALERGTRVNNNMIKSLISGLPFNKRYDVEHTPYIETDATNLFDIIYYTDNYVYGETGVCYVLMGEEYIKEKGDILLVKVRPENRNVVVYYQTFETFDNYNKLHYSFGRYEQANKYILEVALIRKRDVKFMGYTQMKSINGRGTE